MEQDTQTDTANRPVATPPAIEPTPLAAPVEQVAVPNLSSSVGREKSPAIRSIERVTVWIMVLSAIMFALISIMAIWGVLGDNNGEILGRSLGSIAVIAFTALVINIGANMLDRSKKN